MRCIVLFLLLFISFCHAQVGIGTTTPSDASMLEVNGGDATIGYKGLMPPRVPTNAERDAIPAQPTDIGLLIYVESEGCLNIWNGADWENLYCLGDNLSVNPGNVWINEFHYSNTGEDIGEFVEIAGEAGTDLNGYLLLFTNGANGSVYNAINLIGTIPDDGSGFGALSFPVTFNFQNGPDGIALIGPGNTIIQNLSYGGSYVINEPGNILDGATTTDININEPAGTAVGESLQLMGTGSTLTDFVWEGPITQTPGAVNTNQTFN